VKFKLTYIVIPIAIFLTGCDNPHRTKVIQQAEDMEMCRKASMKAYVNGFGEIKCSPKPEEYQNFERSKCDAK